MVINVFKSCLQESKGEAPAYHQLDDGSCNFELEESDDDVIYGYDVATQVSPDFVRMNGGDEFYLQSPTLDTYDSPILLDPYDAPTLEDGGGVSAFDAETQVVGNDPFQLASHKAWDWDSDEDEKRPVGNDPYQYATQKVWKDEGDPYTMATQVRSRDTL